MPAKFEKRISLSAPHMGGQELKYIQLLPIVNTSALPQVLLQQEPRAKTRLLTLCY